MENNSDYKSDNLDDIIRSEHQMVIDGEKLYGEFFKNALDFNDLLQSCLVSCPGDHFIFCAFLGQIQKHSLLAIFSILRRQDTQAMMNLRQVLESSTLAAYSIGEGKYEDFFTEGNEDLFELSNKYKEKAYPWLDKNYKIGSDAIKGMKDLINHSTAHSNLVTAYKSFKLNKTAKIAEIPFFDFQDEYRTKTALWQAGNIIMGVLDLFYGINEQYKVLKFTSDFVTRLKSLESVNNKLKAELMQTDRYKNSIKEERSSQ